MPESDVTDVLAGLRDIRLPPTPDWWPPAPGWWFLATLLVLGLFMLGRWLRGVQRRAGPRREALGCLALIRTEWARTGNAQGLARELSILLRRVALARFPRRQVAGMIGRAWLEFLDQTGRTDRFSAGAGKALEFAPYRERATVPGAELVALADQWIRRVL